MTQSLTKILLGLVVALATTTVNADIVDQAFGAVDTPQPAPNNPPDLDLPFSFSGVDVETGMTVSFDVVLNVDSLNNDGSNINVNVSTGGEFGGSANGNNGLNNGESIVYSVSSISNITPPGFSVAFDGFTAVQVRFAQNPGDEGSINGVDFDVLASADEFVTIADPLPTATVTITGTANFRTEDVRGSFTVTQDTGVLKGDVDLSGTVDFGDIPPFIGVLQGGGFQAEADCDCSTAVNFSDIPAFIAILQGQ